MMDGVKCLLREQGAGHRVAALGARRRWPAAHAHSRYINLMACAGPTWTSPAQNTPAGDLSKSCTRNSPDDDGAAVDGGP